MLTPAQIAEAESFVASIKTPGVRVVCSYCRADLPGSDPTGARVSHGICRPLCGPARAMGWEETDAKPPQPAPQRKQLCFVEWRGYPVKFDPMAVRMVYSLVDRDHETTFLGEEAAQAAATLYGLRTHVRVVPVD